MIVFSTSIIVIAIVANVNAIVIVTPVVNLVPFSPPVHALLPNEGNSTRLSSVDVRCFTFVRPSIV